MTASDNKRLRELEEENRQLKRMFADISLERLRVAYMAGDCIDGAKWIRLGNESIFQ